MGGMRDFPGHILTVGIRRCDSSCCSRSYRGINVCRQLMFTGQLRWHLTRGHLENRTLHSPCSAMQPGFCNSWRLVQNHLQRPPPCFVLSHIVYSDLFLSTPPSVAEGPSTPSIIENVAGFFTFQMFLSSEEHHYSSVQEKFILKIGNKLDSWFESCFI